MKKTIVLLSLLLVFGATAGASVLLNDTFADGSRAETDLPNESAVFFSHPDYLTVNPGSLSVDHRAVGNTSTKMWTYFAPDGAPVSLGVGQQLVATIDFSPRVAFNDSTSRNFRFGLFFDPTDAQYLEDANNDGGNGRWNDSTGYAVQFGLSSGTAGTIQLGKRTDMTNSSLLGSGGAYTWSSGGGRASNLTLDTVYTMTMVLDYQAANEMLVSFAFSQGGTVIGTETLLDNGLGGQPIYTNFDQLFFRMSSYTAVADEIDFHSFKIEYIPEPATIALLGLGGLLSLKRRRC